MCVIVDACTLHKVFGNHEDYCPVMKWVTSGPGKIVLGGSTYYGELANARKYTKILSELDRQGKLVKVDSKLVDESERILLKTRNCKDFDDPHLVALVDESGCRILCSDDSRADRFLKDQTLYKKSKPPIIYRTAKHHTKLLCDKNIAPICRRLD